MEFDDWFKIEKKKNFGLIIKSKMIIEKKKQIVRAKIKRARS